MTTLVPVIRALIRPTLALIFCAAAITMSFMGLIPGEFVAASATSMAAFYFGERSALKRQSETGEKPDTD
jgi:hypothetical protein